MKDKLEIGDKCYSDSHYHGLEPFLITRVTNTLAFNDIDKYDRNICDGTLSEKPIRGGFHAPKYRIATPKLDKKYELQVLKKWFIGVDIKKLTVEQLKQIKAIVEG